MEKAFTYPRSCRKNILRLITAIGTNAETAYAMMLMTAAMTDLPPDDDRVASIILSDCGLPTECA